MSADLIWQVLRTHNAHLVKRDGITLSAEPGNLANQHTFKFSGLANPLTVHVGLKDKKIALTKNQSAQQSLSPSTVCAAAQQSTRTVHPTPASIGCTTLPSRCHEYKVGQGQRV